MKKILLSLALLVVAIAAQAQDDVAQGELNYIFDDETKTATVTQNRWWLDYGGGMGGQWHNTYEGDIVIPETVGAYTVVAIGESAFANLNSDSRSISSISIPKTVKTIGNQAFRGCYNLKSITIPATLESIGNMVFNGSAIETLTISDGDTPLAIGESGSVVGTCLTFDGLKTVYVGRDITLSDYCLEWGGRSTFANAATITDVTYGPKVTKINASEFFRNEAIERVTFLMEEIEIPDNAFKEAKGLTTVVLPGRVTAIGEEAFRDVPSLTSLTLPPTINKIGKEAFRSCQAIKEITIPATATSIGERAFNGSSLEKCTISDSKQSLAIGWNCFDMNEGQLQLYIGRPLIVGDQSKAPWDGVASLREITFGGSYSGMMAKEVYRCNGLQKVVISSPLVTEIPEQAFMNCESLKDVTLNDGIKVIGKEAFRNDKQMAAIALPEQLTTIGESAFYNCKFSSVALPDKLTTIHENAFYNCPLKNITLPASVTLLGRNSFGTEGPLKSIVCLGSTPPVCEGFPFYYTDKARNGEMKLYVPQGAVSAYQNAEHWKEFYSISTEVPTGIEDMQELKIQELKNQVYDLQGRQVSRGYENSNDGNLTPRSSVLAPQKKGIYIINGRKVIVP